MEEVVYIPKSIFVYNNSEIFYKTPNGSILPNRQNTNKIIKFIKDPINSTRVIEVPNDPGIIKLISNNKNSNSLMYSPDLPIYLDEDKGIMAFSYQMGFIDNAIMKYGMRDGILIGKMVYAFTCNKNFSGDSYEGGYDKFPARIKLLKVGTEEYDQAVKMTQLIDNFKCDSWKDLQPGHHYIEFNSGYTDGSLPRIVTYLGNLKFANGSWSKGVPGSKYKSIPIFITYGEKEEKIFTLKTNKLVYESDKTPLSSEELLEWIEKFESSPWSWKFWNTPGLIDHFEYLNIQKSNYLRHISSKFKTSRYLFDEAIQMSYKITSGPTQILNCINCNKYNPTIKSNVGKSLRKDFNPCKFDCSDPSKPIKITQLPSESSEKTLNRMGGKSEWFCNPESLSIPDDFPKYVPTTGFMCVTMKGKYEFLGMAILLQTTYWTEEVDTIYGRVDCNDIWMVARKR